MSCVCRNASAINTGMNVPDVFSPTSVRNTTTTSAPTGSSMISLNMFCSSTGRLYSDRLGASMPCAPDVASDSEGRVWLMIAKLTRLRLPPITSSTLGVSVCHSSRSEVSAIKPVSGSNRCHSPSCHTCTQFDERLPAPTFLEDQRLYAARGHVR